MHALRALVVVAATVIAGAAWAIPAVPQNYTFTFIGSCEDCADDHNGGFGPGENAASATLGLKNYILGTPLTNDNFNSFTYTSDRLGTLVADFPTLDGLQGVFFSTSPGFADISLDFPGPYRFVTHVDGSWSVTFIQIIGDFGDQESGIWNSGLTQDVPEPMSGALLGIALLGLRIARRRRG